MYEYIKGKITDINSTYITLENNNIGYAIYTGNPYYYQLDKEYKFVSSVYPNDCCLGYKIINDLKITRGAMILDGYDCYDSCIKYMDELIEKYTKLRDKAKKEFVP